MSLGMTRQNLVGFEKIRRLDQFVKHVLDYSSLHIHTRLNTAAVPTRRRHCRIANLSPHCKLSPLHQKLIAAHLLAIGSVYDLRLSPHLGPISGELSFTHMLLVLFHRYESYLWKKKKRSKILERRSKRNKDMLVISLALWET